MKQNNLGVTTCRPRNNRNIDIKMSDCFVRFIPEDVNVSLFEDNIKLIEKLKWNDNIPKFIFNQQTQFALPPFTEKSCLQSCIICL